MGIRFGPLTGKVKVSLAAMALVLVYGSGCWGAAPVQVISSRDGSRKITLEMGRSVIISSQAPIARVASASEEIATVTGLSPTQVYVTGKGPGVTNVTLWQSEDKVAAVYDVEVIPDISRMKEKIHQLYPEEKSLRITASHDSMTLAGTVTSASVLAQVVALAEAYAADKKVVNLLQVAGVHQIMLEVRVAEMSRTLTKRLTIDFVAAADGSIGTSLLGSLATIKEFVGSAQGGSLELEFAKNTNALFHITGGDVSFTGFLDALKEDGLIKVLAEPTLITLSGQTAHFLAGGEFPVPIPQGLGTVAIEYKPYGVALSFTPTVLADNRINMKVAPEVSELDYNTAVVITGITIPGITTRRVSTNIELADGQSFAIAGLLKDTIRETIGKFPFLGDVPVLGALFRSSKFQRNETELIVIVTPHLVKPLNLSKQPLPTDGYGEPSDTDFFLWGMMQSRDKTPPSSPVGRMGRDNLEGEFGHAIPK